MLAPGWLLLVIRKGRLRSLGRSDVSAVLLRGAGRKGDLASVVYLTRDWEFESHSRYWRVCCEP